MLLDPLSVIIRVMIRFAIQEVLFFSPVDSVSKPPSPEVSSHQPHSASLSPVPQLDVRPAVRSPSSPAQKPAQGKPLTLPVILNPLPKALLNALLLVPPANVLVSVQLPAFE